MTPASQRPDVTDFAVAIVLEGLSDEGGTEAQATALAEGLSSIGRPTLFASRWPLSRHGERVMRLQAAGVDVVTPKWTDSRGLHSSISSYNLRRAFRAGQLAFRRHVLPTAAALAADEQAVSARDHDVRAILLRKLRRWARRRAPLPTVVHVLARHTAVLIPDLRRLGLPLVYSELGQPDYYTGGLVPTPALDVDVMTADSAEAARLLQARDAREVLVIPSIGGFAEPTTPPSLHATRFVMVNRLHPDKRVELAIRATATLGSPFTLEIIGSGPAMPELEAVIKDLAVEDRVTLGRAVGRQQVRASMDAADAFVIASSTEGTPISVLEAMSRARCVVAAPVGGLPDLLQHGREGLFFDGTVGDLSLAMRRLADEAGLARDLGCAARERWLTSLSPDKIVQRYEGVYKQLLAARAVSVTGGRR